MPINHPLYAKGTSLQKILKRRCGIIATPPSHLNKYRIFSYWLRLDGEDEGFEPNYGDAGEVADEGEPGDATEVPHERYLFNAHCHHTGC